jgi:hypothetical protein
MNFSRLAITGCVAAALVALPGISLAAESHAPQATRETREASRLLKGIAADAHHIRAHARKVEKLQASSHATYKAYDRQWNDIKPNVEDMSLKFSRLENMRATVLPWQQAAIDRSAPEVKEIAGNLTEFRTYLNTSGISMTSPMFKTYGERLSKEASELSQTVKQAKAEQVKPSQKTS